MSWDLERAIFFAGVLQLFVLVASAMVPMHLNWREVLSPLPKLVRQLFWVYGGYIVIAIIALGLICVLNADELASGSGLARGVCAYAAVFWGVRLSLQAVFDAKPHLTRWYLVAGYHTLTGVFVLITGVMLWGVFRGG